ncbi:hypothetical protein B0A55_09603 [Friedmanniomyces simplex]|uniref:Uncharacterized protein n=1 Tax=Friedmanniomyces simplex TaxID=329884 RepID=A0A4U0WX37_9PEZI|nr:hypothetical protein B0A55_09603 [Friedmanniomyces simplex]
MSPSLKEGAKLAGESNKYRISAAMKVLDNGLSVTIPAAEVKAEQDLQVATKRFQAAKERFNAEEQRLESAQIQKAAVERRAEMDRTAIASRIKELTHCLTHCDGEDPKLEKMIAPYVFAIPHAGASRTERVHEVHSNTPHVHQRSKISWGWTQLEENFVAASPCVVRHPNGTWFELACPICHGNSSSDRRRGFFGVKGFYDHLSQGHGEPPKGVSVAEVIEWCQVRELTGGEVEALRSGSRDAVAIAPVSTTTKLTKKLKTARANTRDDEDRRDSPTEPAVKKIKAFHSFEELVGSEDSDTDGKDEEVEHKIGLMATDVLETAAETGNGSLGSAQSKTQARMLTERYDSDEEE